MNKKGKGSWIPISSDKLQTLINYIYQFEGTLNNSTEVALKKELYESALLDIKRIITETITYLQFHEEPHDRFEEFKIRLAKLKSLELQLFDALSDLGIQVDEEVNSFYFDVDLKLNESHSKELLSNHLEIRNEILDYLKANENKKIDYPHKDIFESKLGYDIFKDYVDSYIIDVHMDFSYLFQRLKKEGLIKKVTHPYFINWLYENNYTTDEQNKILYEKNGFASLKKTSAAHRVNNFNVIYLELKG